ncbi:hypothetical protein DPMN_129000 [Dreissena polymorpha]|uniref:Uncharacterized protein n=1 Tax=Dreissena polymorpha TaxID=45954 RepID=A0A9D4H0G0_DREPO|nr:hypothetical protein DPMN_129000 [Dreissena polymorpha]
MNNSVRVFLVFPVGGGGWLAGGAVPGYLPRLHPLYQVRRWTRALDPGTAGSL